jgi:hypothetical protein
MRRETRSGTTDGDRWTRVAEVLRESGVTERVEGELPPPGLVTRIVARARADGRADAFGLLRWRRWTVAGAGAAVAVLAISFYAVPETDRNAQFMPVPRLEIPNDLPE